MRASDGTVIPCVPIPLDKSPNGPPPRPSNARNGVHAHANEGFVSEKDHVVMNPLYEGKHDVGRHKVSNLDRRHGSSRGRSPVGNWRGRGRGRGRERERESGWGRGVRLWYVGRLQVHHNE